VHTKRSPEFLLCAFGILLVICLGAVAYGHAQYTAAEKVYEGHLKHVVIKPHADSKGELNTYALAADKWLRVRTAASAIATVAIVGVLWQVVRRRHTRNVESLGDEA
jgi:ABC-type Fe3+-siderophore transport system permease subunit